MIYIAHCLACIRRANDRVSTVQTLPYISRTKYIQNLLCLSNNQQCYFNSDTESALDAICYFTGFISSECCILVMRETDCQLLVSIWAYISGVQVRGATALQRCTQNPKIENVHLFTKPLCQSALRRQFKISFILHPLAIACANFGATPNFAPKNVSPNFQNS